MVDLMMRDAAPLDQEGWAKVDGMVLDVAKKNLIARRFLPLVGPLGWGVDQAPLLNFGQVEGAASVTGEVAYLPLVERSAQFYLTAKQMVMALQTPFGLDLGAVAIATSSLCREEDDLLIGKLLEKAGSEGALGNWDEINGPFRAIAVAIAKMQGKGIDGPFATVMSPAMYARLVSLMQHGRREVDMVSKLVTAGLYQSRSMDQDKVLLISAQPWNIDMVVGQDMATAYLGNEGLDHLFRIFETLALRIKRPEAICVLS